MSISVSTRLKKFFNLYIPLKKVAKALPEDTTDGEEFSSFIPLRWYRTIVVSTGGGEEMANR